MYQQTPTTGQPFTGFLREKQLRQQGFAPFARSTMWRKVKDGSFPAPIKLSERVTVWRVLDLMEWAASQGGAK
jgi:prophage regulatory protein